MLQQLLMARRQRYFYRMPESVVLATGMREHKDRLQPVPSLLSRTALMSEVRRVKQAADGRE